MNTSVAIAAGEGILLSKNQSLSTDCLTKDWAKYLFTRMGLVKRKGNTKAKVDAEKFDEIKKLFHQDIRNVLVMDEVPVELVVNWDLISLNYVPVSQWTMVQEGAKQVEIHSKDDKRQITAVFGRSMSGDFLPPQLVYQGKTAKCLPSYQFPSDWNITHAPNHWSNETMEFYITKVILPYLVDTKRKLKLPPGHPALLLFDNFKGQCTEKLLDRNMINAVLIPPNCTGRLQPVDLSVNKAAKKFLRKCFQKWYTLQVCSQLEGKTSKEPIDLRLSVMKPIGAKWLVELYDYMKSKPEIMTGPAKTGHICTNYACSEKSTFLVPMYDKKTSASFI